VGYAQVRTVRPPACVVPTNAIELWRFYVARAWHGRGVAQELMVAVVQAARAAGGETLWLGVWELNPRAQAFYKKSGFVDVGTQTFLLGIDEQNDRVMAMSLRQT
jgi:ribosomal protein S18 acetylase RimI-like enzyme